MSEHDTAPEQSSDDSTEQPAEQPVKRTTRRKKAAPAATDQPTEASPQDQAADQAADVTTEPEARPRRRTRKATAAAEPAPEPADADEAEPAQPAQDQAESDQPADQPADEQPIDEEEVAADEPAAPTFALHLSHAHAERPVEPESPVAAPASPFALFVAPEEVVVPRKQAPAETDSKPAKDDTETTKPGETSDDASSDRGDEQDGDEPEDGSRRRRRGRRGRGRRTGEDAETDRQDGDDDKKTGGETPPDASGSTDDNSRSGGDSGSEDDDSSDSADDEGGSSRRRRRRRRRGGGGDDNDDSGNGSSSVVSRSSADRVKGVTGSVRLEAKRQRRKEGRDAGRRRAPILTEAEFLARRESVSRRMVVRQQGDRTQIAVLEDDVLVEHYVTLASDQSFAGGVYYGRVQNVLPSMEAAFVDIGKRRNAVLYAGEVNWDAAALEGKQRNIEQAMKSGDKLLVQVTKDPIGHKGARLTSQVSLPGRYLVYVPGGGMTGISRKLPEGERHRLKEILRRIVPNEAGVIIRTAAEGATEEQLARDVNRLKAQWEVIEGKIADTKTPAPSVLYEEPDLAIRVVRDLFNEDFESMVISGDDAWDTISSYMEHVAPDLTERVSRYEGEADVFAEHRIDEQLAKALGRKVWLPSGGSLVIDHTEAMTVIDVNTGKFTGSGGNLEQTVTKNNLEAAEEIVRQLRLRDIGGIVVIDFIDMLLESNRELVLRRLTECLGRDRTKHQVAEVTSLGLVQMTRKRVGQGLLDAFSEPCEHCEGRGLIVHDEPIEKKTASPTPDNGGRERRSNRRSRGAKEEKPAAPRRDSSAQLSAIAAATLPKGNGDDEPADEAEQATEHQTPEQPADQSAPQESTAPDTGHAPDTGNGVPPQAPEVSTSDEQPDTLAAGAPSAGEAPAAPAPRRRRAARRAAGPPSSAVTQVQAGDVDQPGVS